VKDVENNIFRYIIMSGNTWTNFVKDWAKENDTTYMCAISKPELKQAYKEHKQGAKAEKKKNSFQEIKDAVVSIATERTPVVEKKSRGRPSKYATEEEKKKAKKEKTLASTRRIRAADKERAAKIAAEEKARRNAPPTKEMVEKSQLEKLEEENRELEKKVEREKAEMKRRLAQQKERDEADELKRRQRQKDSELIITPTEVKDILNQPKPPAWVKINNLPTMVRKPTFHQNRREYPDPYGYNIQKTTILKDDITVYPFRYLLPNNAYQSWGNSHIWYDPDTLQPLGQVVSVFDYNEERPETEKLKIALMDDRNWVFIPTPLGKIRLKELMK
jgi:hypothetical protein